MHKIIRVTTVPISLGGLLKGQLNYMSQYYEIIGVSSKGKVTGGVSEIETVGARENIKVIPVEMTRKITPIQDLKAVYTLYKIFKKEKPTIVHSHTPKAGTLAMLAAKLAKVPNRLHTIAGLPLLEAVGAKRLLLDKVEKITYACATKIYPNSYGLQQIIKEQKYTTSEKVKVIGKGSSNGIDTTHFNPALYSEADVIDLKKQLNITPNDVVFIFVGRLVKDKGINELIIAFKQLSHTYENCKLLLVGSYEKELDPIHESSEKEIETNTRIISVGWQQDVRPYFAIADVLTFPSYREGFPNVVMQAGAMGIPSIVTNINGCNEIIQEGVNGNIIPVKNNEALYLKMEIMLTQKAFRNQLAENSRGIIKNSYERSYIWQELLKEYESLSHV